MFRRRAIVICLLALLAAFLLQASGCGDSKSGGTMSADQHARIEKGMTLDDVEAIAGAPERTHKSGSSKDPNIIWYYGKAEGDGLVRVSFIGGKVDNVSPYDQSVTPEE